MNQFIKTEYNQDSLVAQIIELQNAVQELSTQQAQVHAQAQQVVHLQSSATPVQYVVADPIAMPDRFSGGARFPLSSFKLSVERVFELSSGRFPSPRSKIIFIGNLLDGPARRWFDSMQLLGSDESERILSDLVYFWEVMTRHFGLKDSRLQSEIKLLRFKQSKLSVAEFGIRYKQLASTVEFYERALVANFIANLNDDVLDFLRRNVIPEKLDELIQLCSKFDIDYLDPGRKVAVSKHSTSTLNNNMMDISVIDVFEDEVDSDKKLICNYCRMRGHIKKNCKRLLSKSAKFSEDPKASATHH